MSLSHAERLAHSTVRIECDLPGGIGTGTGFFYSLDRNGDRCVPVIVTNKHVVANASRGRFLLTLRGTDGLPNVGQCKAYELDQFEQRWLPHPDPLVDLCVMPMAPLLQAADKSNTQFFFAPLDKSLIPSADEIDDMVGLESITMIGYPNGLWDSVNNLPIFRRGMLATDYKRDWNGKKEFLIDAACFPGSSGSPVMLVDGSGYQTKKRTVTGITSRVKLLGILYAGPQHTVEGEIRVVLVPTQQKAISLAGIPNNLGIIIKAEQLLAFEGKFA